MFLRSIAKKFDVDVFKNISFQFEVGKRYAIFGKNGSGKTTLLDIMNGDLVADDGELDFHQYNTMFIRNNSIPFPFMSAIDFIRQTCELKGLKFDERKVTELLAEFSLTDRANDRLNNYSKGMQYKVLLIIALLSPVDILLLDEPFTELDMMTVYKLNDLFNTYLPMTTLIFTTHSLEIAQKVAHEYLLLLQNALKIIPLNSVELENILLQEMKGDSDENLYI